MDSGERTRAAHAGCDGDDTSSDRDHRRDSVSGALLMTAVRRVCRSTAATATDCCRLNMPYRPKPTHDCASRSDWQHR